MGDSYPEGEKYFSPYLASREKFFVYIIRTLFITIIVFNQPVNRAGLG